MPCFSYTVHLTLYTLHREQKIFFMFFSLSPEGHISMFIYHSPARVRTLFTYTRSLHAVRHLNSRQAIHAKPTRRQAIHCACAIRVI